MKIERWSKKKNSHFVGQQYPAAAGSMHLDLCMEKEKKHDGGGREVVITHFSAVYIFDSRFSEEEVDEIAVGK